MNQPIPGATSNNSNKQADAVFPASPSVDVPSPQSPSAVVSAATPANSAIAAPTPVQTNATAVVETNAGANTTAPTSTPVAASVLALIPPEIQQQVLMQLLSSIPALSALTQAGANSAPTLSVAQPPRGGRHPPHVVEKLRLWFDTKTKYPNREDRDTISRETGAFWIV